MDTLTLVSLLIGGTIALLISGVSLVLVRSSGSIAEQRLDDLSGGRKKAKAEQSAKDLLRAPPIDATQKAFLARFLPSLEGLEQLYEQADMDLSFQKFMGIVAVLTITGGVAGFFLLPLLLAPVGALVLGALPFLFLFHRKKQRVQKFMAALPEAVELMSRALRAGQGLAASMNLVSEEMRGPIADEFGRVFEEQNLGVPLEVSLRGMAERVPAMDVRFLVTAIVIQRATGGDLAEVLDKIGRLIRQRYELMGHVKSLTAEGRLSGVVLLSLPPGLVAFLCFSNYSYISILFETPVGTKMLAATAVLQVLGALAIKKIVAIKV
ncbi:type II secretion system F family protein [soil metagenome]